MTDSGGPPGLPRGWAEPPPISAARQPDRGAYDLEGGVIDVRPLRFTDILDGSFSLMRAGLREMVALVLVVMVPLQLLSAYLQREALSFGVVGVLDDPAAADLLLGQGGISPGLLLTTLTQVAIAPVLGGALVLIAGRRYLGQRADLATTVAETARKAGWLVLAYIAGALLRAAPLLLVLVAVAAGSDVGVALAVALAGVVILGLTPLLALVAPAIMLEPRRPVAAFGHAIALVRGAYWRTTGVVIGTTLVFNLLALLLAGIPNVIGFIGGFGFAWVLVAFGSVLSQLIVAPLTASAMVLLHADLRIRQEGMDFDVIIQQMRPTAATA